MDTQAPVLSVRGVSVAYDAAPVISDISFDVAHGETFGLIGLNGAGKTSLIKAILGLREPVAGSVAIDGADRLAPASKARIAYLPERFDPPWFLSGMEFVRFSLSLYGRAFDAAEIREAARGIALAPEVLENRVQTYSKGMRQKLGLLGTVLTGCPLLILDEPMSGLDPRARARVKDLLMQARGQGRAVFLSSHILADMDEICDRVAVLHGGSLMFAGTPEALREKAGCETLERAFLKVIEKSEAA